MLRSLTKIAINHFGYDVRRVPSPSTVHIAELGTDPITFEYIRKLRGYAVLEITVADARAFQGLALPLAADIHPFVRAVTIARRLDSNEAIRTAIEAELRRYYETVRPSSAANLLDLTRDQLPGDGGSGSQGELDLIDASFLPWGRSPAELIVGRERCVAHEGLQNKAIVNVADGVTAFGPVSATKLALEVDRLAKLTASIKARGFTRFDPRNALQVSALRRDDSYRWTINSGQHRFAAAAAFGIETLPAMVTDVVRREDARHWPQVVDGYFTEEGALAVFDRMFDAVPSKICENWFEDSV